MSKVITFSRTFPKHHPKSGEHTYFIERLWASWFPKGIPKSEFDSIVLSIPELGWSDKNVEPKHHTIRAGKRWSVGDKFSPRVWSGKPYNSSQIIIAPDIEIKKVWDFQMKPALFWDECIFFSSDFKIDHEKLKLIVQNDGLTMHDFFLWFSGGMQANSKRKPFEGQIICWNENIKYE